MKKLADMNSRYYDLRGKIVKAERRIATLTERGEMWEQYNRVQVYPQTACQSKAGKAEHV